MKGIFLLSSSAISTHQLTIILLTVCFIFIVLIGIAIIKMYKLKAQNKKLMETNAFKDMDDSYKDFTGGHLYGDN
ncbi:MAG: hypothetical protein ED556_07500 [Winogradskyella sp.]|uniref:hypothetical protein n=1 Tax=Winogradskyella sp. TaxID=1883156 RepID=UPI000F4079A6|nr:hypothetical protein [Winogradskyella sp.]RNC87255.1 MAG: hypothetical protein ED556_07500 [Winogradskyella sp.]